MKYIKLFLQILIIVLASSHVTAQNYIQKGYVKTKGRWVNGQLVSGKPLTGVKLNVRGRTSIVVRNNNGSFSFPTTGKFIIDKVERTGYQVIADVMPKQFAYSSNPLYLLMETPEQQLKDELETKKALEKTLRRQLKSKEDEIGSLRSKCKQKEAELNKQLTATKQQLENLRKNNTDNQKQISDLESKVAELENLIEENEKTDDAYRKQLQQLYSDSDNNEKLIEEMSKRYAEMDFDQLDELNQRISACILEGRLAEADSLIRSKGDVHERFQQLEHIHDAIESEAVELSTSCNSIGGVYYSRGDYSKALEYYEKALKIDLEVYGNNHPAVATSYYNIAMIYNKLSNYHQALEYANKAYEINKSIFGEDNENTIRVYEFIKKIQEETEKSESKKNIND